MRHADWVSLPGPSFFLDEVERDLRDTKSVMTVVPSCFDSEWLDGLKHRLDGIYEWKASPATCSQFLAKISTRSDGQPFVHPREIVEGGVKQRAFLLVDPPLEHWDDWRKFLRNFSEVNRAVNEFDRSVFLVTSDGLHEPLPNEVLLSSRQIERYLRAEDSLFHASHLVRATDTWSVVNQIRLHICAELGLWDFELCGQLLSLTLGELLEPVQILREIGARRGIDAYSACDDEKLLRRNGLLFDFGRTQLRHSALLALRGDAVAIRRRVWISQVKVLFPLIEEQRFRLLAMIRKIDPGILSQYSTETGDDLLIEIGPMYDLIGRSKSCSPSMKHLARKLKNMRNKLAHLDICRPSDLPGDEEWL